ncbi:hypothetical protein I6F35_38170 [Bradyrhizobium sp. BRP22]|uniref:hypothetical protein n=1 Tax=Bradyrhizobium sp. BRP22 TaxID=2793821 RepID=UPI001CD1FCA7|nr:hypothetical protein [Bradyrhizobium sp. BRP22]MCA1458890.1 hypothetical protein [Bradyrhizobium sp. BRP22]
MQLRELFREQGRNDGSVSPIIDKLLNEKGLKRVGPGEYTAVKRKKTIKRRKSAASPAPHLNGGSHAGETING